jgi:hypothetical protein
LEFWTDGLKNSSQNFYVWSWSDEHIKFIYDNSSILIDAEEALILKGNLTSRSILNHYGFICEQQRNNFL